MLLRGLTFLLFWTLPCRADLPWAWQPLQVGPGPDSGNPVDDCMKPEHPPADPRAWIRRVTFDLTGLPPQPHETAAFLADSAPGARERVIDRLLASPRYGERMARLWMDAVHFAETHGHDQDRIRENAWPYRDYLIRSFNEDKPYARFVQEQIAGDVLFPEDPQAIVALGFLAAGPWDESSLRDIREDTLDRQIARYLDRDDMIATTMQTFCSVTVQCARCHDHKFDPIPQRDYYALQAVFAGVDRADRLFDADPDVHVRRRELTAAVRRAAGWPVAEPLAWTANHGSTLTPAGDGSLRATGSRPDREILRISLTNARADARYVRLDVLTDSTLPQIGPGRADNGNFHLTGIGFSAAGVEVKPVAAVASFNQVGWDIQKALDDSDTTAWGIFPQTGRSHWAVFRFAEPLPPGPLEVTLQQLHGGGHVAGRVRIRLRCSEPPESALADLPAPQRVYAAAHDFEPDGGLVPGMGVPREVRLLVRGEITRPADAIEPAALSAVSIAFPDRDYSREEDRRAALAEWLTSDANPLIWRSIVNRVWHWHARAAPVATPNDFGAMGASPQHPELLDRLARWFRDEANGSLKRLHRLLLTSRIFQQTESRRLDAEELHDAMLAVSGCLDLTMGGPSDREFSLKPGVHVTPVIDYAAGARSRRRSVYRFLFRTLPDPWMEALDCPAGDQLTPDRQNSVSVQQALALWNK